MVTIEYALAGENNLRGDAGSVYRRAGSERGLNPVKTQTLGLLYLVTLLVGCGDDAPETTSHLRMVDERLGEGPWQVVTYDGKRVTRDTVALDGGDVVIRSSSVYVNKESQFTLRDGTPIKIFTGDEIYWNSEGDVITRKLQRVPEYLVFSLEGRPLPENTALTLQDYSPARESKL